MLLYCVFPCLFRISAVNAKNLKHACIFFVVLLHVRENHGIESVRILQMQSGGMRTCVMKECSSGRGKATSICQRSTLNERGASQGVGKWWQGPSPSMMPFARRVCLAGLFLLFGWVVRMGQKMPWRCRPIR